MTLADRSQTTAWSVFLLLSRLIGGGGLALAGFLKLKGGPLIFQLSIEKFGLTPEWANAPLAYYLPWLEVIGGLALIAGVWVRQSALVCAGLYVAFTFGLTSAILRGIDMDCGCFSGIFGEAKVGWNSIARNAVFIAATALPLVLGGGRFVLLRESSTSPPQPGAP